MPLFRTGYKGATQPSSSDAPSAVDAQLLENKPSAPTVVKYRTGNTLPSGKGATAARPNAILAGPGTRWYDTTLVKPIWSDGTVWRDATGTAV